VTVGLLVLSFAQSRLFVHVTQLYSSKAKPCVLQVVGVVNLTIACYSSCRGLVLVKVYEWLIEIVCEQL